MQYIDTYTFMEVQIRIDVSLYSCARSLVQGCLVTGMALGIGTLLYVKACIQQPVMLLPWLVLIARM
eukprot:6957489-Lingulodinium_polyedra.AAC.1